MSSEFQTKLERWNYQPGIVTAGELVGAAIVEGREARAGDAAQLLLRSTSTATPLLQGLAKSLLDRAGARKEGEVDNAPDRVRDKALWRRRTRWYPKNAMAWVELALHELVDRNLQRARRCMNVALQLAPNDRHVVRSACRLLIHLGKVDEAYALLRRTERSRVDPWLAAAELAVAPLANRRPSLVRTARALLGDGNLLPRQSSELSGALGTLELEAGNVKRARGLFRASAIDPTGNALAQVAWASLEVGTSLVSTRTFAKTREKEEARVFNLLRSERFTRVPYHCERWSTTEPYSIRPYEFSSSASTVTGNHEDTIRVAEKGLRIKPTSEVLLNNYAFALAHCGQLDRAAATLGLINPTTERSGYLTSANRGLVAMRQGHVDLGIVHYREAIVGFLRIGETRSADVARIYRAREAALVNAPNLNQIVSIGRDAYSRLRSNALRHVLATMDRALRTASK